MPELTRRRYSERQDCWHIYFGDVHVGTISRRVGQPHDEDPWDGCAASIPAPTPASKPAAPLPSLNRRARTFEQAWLAFSARRTEADYQAWRDQRGWTAKKYAMHESGERMPTQKPNPMMLCPCGETFDSQRLAHTLIHVPHITAAQRAG
jgi:hypothetical protein